MRGIKAFQLVSKFALVGLSATLLYAVLATVFEMHLDESVGQATVSIAAYAIAAVFSYSAHRVFTFASNGAYRLEIPRFALLTVTGAALSFALPAIIGGFLGLPMFVSVASVCVVIPLINFLALDRWVFGDRHSR